MLAAVTDSKAGFGVTMLASEDEQPKRLIVIRSTLRTRSDALSIALAQQRLRSDVTSIGDAFEDGDGFDHVRRIANVSSIEVMIE